LTAITVAVLVAGFAKFAFDQLEFDQGNSTAVDQPGLSTKATASERSSDPITTPGSAEAAHTSKAVLNAGPPTVEHADRRVHAAVTDLIARSVSDPDAADQVRVFLGLCSYAFRQSQEGIVDSRLAHPLWQPIFSQCMSGAYEQALAAIPGAARDTSADGRRLDAAHRALSGTLEGREQLDEVARSILQSSNNPAHLSAAAHSYFEIERVRARLAGRWPQSVGESADGLRMDLALMASCLPRGSSCGSSSLNVISNCVRTAGCTPGSSMQDIIRWRRSPQELAAIEELIAEIIRLRARGG
jgi:hypothetical protein